MTGCLLRRPCRTPTQQAYVRQGVPGVLELELAVAKTLPPPGLQTPSTLSPPSPLKPKLVLTPQGKGAGAGKAAAATVLRR